MKSIPNIILFIIILFSGVVVQAQNATGIVAHMPKTTFGVKLGGNLSTLKGQDASFDIIEPKLGFQIGATVDFAFTDNLYLLYGLDLTQKGYKLKDNNTITYRAMYLQLPIHIGYKLRFNVMDIVFRGGPYLAYGIGGKTKSDKPNTDKLNFFGKNSGEANKVDVGIGIALGSEFGKFGVYLGYDWGFIKLYEKDTDTYNGNAYLTIGYKF